ncbi:unnamed protein product [Caenorhabditis auriculariae]|uniref:Protein-tyrosine-phosphatase n=1 Tax=Caenorhabditis auriculariae TaxID=2777116 RepID=A0A8S1GWQ3_9PELO|nr:unnamed protein product [Caenorhabditis auriculariae]
MDTIQTASKNESDNRLKWSRKLFIEKPTVKQLYKEFVNNKKWKPETMSSKAMNENPGKCRYTDIVCLDSTRVVLKERPPEADFIHANWMKMPDGVQYISTQGPMEETIEDFWHMIYTEKVSVVIMLCAFSEGKFSKSAYYYPMKSDYEKYGQYKVIKKGLKQSNIDNVKYRVLDVEKNGKSLTVHHFSYTSWPDHIAPTSPTFAVQLHRLARQKANGGPIVVHCSAGIGRTATFIGIDYGMQRVRENSNLAPFDLIKEMRRMRDKSVQSYFQYAFMIVCILEIFAQDNAIPRNDKLKSYIEEYNNSMTKKKEKLDK